MLMRLEEVAKQIGNIAGWKNPIKNNDGVITFELNDGLNFNIHSPNGQKIIFFSYLKTLPSDDFTAKGVIEKCAKHSLATAKTSKAVISVNENKFMLHQDVSDLNELEIPEQAKDFLNSLAKWKNFLNSL